MSLPACVSPCGFEVSPSSLSAAEFCSLARRALPVFAARFRCPHAAEDALMDWVLGSLRSGVHSRYSPAAGPPIAFVLGLARVAAYRAAVSRARTAGRSVLPRATPPVSPVPCPRVVRVDLRADLPALLARVSVVSPLSAEALLSLVLAGGDSSRAAVMSGVSRPAFLSRVFRARSALLVCTA